MKKILWIMLAVLLLAPQKFKATAVDRNPNGAVPGDNPATMDVNHYAEGDDDIFSSSYEREMLSRRFFQKNLPPLSRREKIIWAFKTARSNILL